MSNSYLIMKSISYLIWFLKMSAFSWSQNRWIILKPIQIIKIYSYHIFFYYDLHHSMWNWEYSIFRTATMNCEVCLNRLKFYKHLLLEIHIMCIYIYVDIRNNCIFPYFINFAICSCFEKRISTIHYITKQNVGMCGNIRKLINFADYDYNS